MAHPGFYGGVPPPAHMTDTVLVVDQLRRMIGKRGFYTLAAHHRVTIYKFNAKNHEIARLFPVPDLRESGDFYLRSDVVFKFTDTERLEYFATVGVRRIYDYTGIQHTPEELEAEWLQLLHEREELMYCIAEFSKDYM